MLAAAMHAHIAVSGTVTLSKPKHASNHSRAAEASGDIDDETIETEDDPALLFFRRCCCCCCDDFCCATTVASSAKKNSSPRGCCCCW